MKKTILSKSIVFLFILVSIMFCCSCSNNSEEAPSVESVNISISIDFPEKAKFPDLKTLPFRVEEETSALQAIELYGNVNDISILMDTTYLTLEGIDGVINGVTLKTGQWQYKINGETKDKSIDDVILKEGDHLELIYANTKEPQ